MQVASYGKCRKTRAWELNRARYRSQWIDKSTTRIRIWLGYVYPSRASMTTSNLGYDMLERDGERIAFRVKPQSPL